MSSKHRKHSSKTEAAPQAASQEPTLPPIVDPPYQPSSVATNNFGVFFISADKYQQRSRSTKYSRPNGAGYPEVIKKGNYLQIVKLRLKTISTTLN